MTLYTKKDRILQILSDFITVIIIGAVFFVVYLFIEPYKRGFYCDDLSIRFPHKADTIPLWLAGLYGGLAGVLFVIFTELFINKQCCVDEEEFSQRQTRWILNSLNGVLLYSLGAACTMLITEIGKRSIGRLRPHFIDVCKPRWDAIDCFADVDGVKVANYIPMSEKICSGDKHLIREARVSFPSGHSSFTAYSMLFVIIYIEARITLKKSRFIKSLIQLSAFIATWHTCMSRVSDFKHHHTDVIAGAAIGISVALFVTLVTGRQIWDFQRIRRERKDLEELEDGDKVQQLQAYMI